MRNISNCFENRKSLSDQHVPILLCGMDFSGKSSIADAIVKLSPSKYEIRKKYLSLVGDPLQCIRNTNDKMSPEDWVSFWARTAIADAKGWVETDRIVILDSLAPFKHYALIATGLETDYIPNMMNFAAVLHAYPEMKVFFFVVSYEERMRRMENRKELSVTDRLVMDRHSASIAEIEYIEILTKCFNSVMVLNIESEIPNTTAEFITRCY